MSGLLLTLPSASLPLQAADLPPLIPRDILFGNPEIVAVDLSPDGSRLAYLAPLDGVLNLWVRDLDGRRPPRPLTRSQQRPQRAASWTSDGRYLISSRDGDGDENTVLVRIDPETGAMVDLTPSRGVKATVETFDRDVPDELVVGLNDRDPRYHDLHVLEISTGRRTLLQRVEDGRPIAVQRIDGFGTLTCGWSLCRMVVLPMNCACRGTGLASISPFWI